ncbi:MAG TPA: GntR family transcriptional regulator [Solirubrobacter sp.]|nr:GntR family transcriptional regulator [Solirubrobacter sp.]
MTDPSRTPVAYQMLAANLREAIARGDYARGERLPTEAELSSQYNVSRQTVRRALLDLVTEGLVYRVRGRGTFATSIRPGTRYLRSFGSVEDLLAYSLDTTMETIQPLRRRADVDAASRLQLVSDEVMVGLVRRAHAEAPFCVTRIAVSVETGVGLIERGVLRTAGDVTPLTVFSVVNELSPNRIAGVHQSITSVRVPPEYESLIGCEPGDPSLRIDRLYYDTQGTPLELAISYFNPERYSYRVELSRRFDP